MCNYPLYLDQLLRIVCIEGVKHIALELALGLVVLHWGALVDGMDVEFAFSGTSNSKSLIFNPNGGKRAVQLCLLDFDKATKLRLPRDGKEGFGETEMCKQMVTAVTANNPYFPTPNIHDHAGALWDEDGCVEKQVWEAFEETYVAASRVLIVRNEQIKRSANLSTNEERSKAWPKAFLRMWKTRAAEIREGEDGGSVVFG